jgi:AraC-like DNA-binding protein
MKQKTHVEVEKCEKENTILKDFSGFKWYSFLPGDEKMDDFSVMKISGSIDRFLPQSYFVPCYTIQIITGGSITVNINNKDYELSAHSGYVLMPEFYVQQRPFAHVEMYTMAFTRKFAKELNPKFKLAELSQVLLHPTWTMPAQKTERLVHYFELLRKVLDDKNREAAKHLVYSILEYLAGGSSFDKRVSPTLSREEEITGRFLVLVDEHCMEQHALDWYASELCLSTRYVANTVKQTLGMTASSCIERAIMQHAKTLLYSTTMPIQEIADQLGFQNQSHFGAFFKRHEGMSPAAFRKQQ